MIKYKKKYRMQEKHCVYFSILVTKDRQVSRRFRSEECPTSCQPRREELRPPIPPAPSFLGADSWPPLSSAHRAPCQQHGRRAGGLAEGEPRQVRGEEGGRCPGSSAIT